MASNVYYNEYYSCYYNRIYSVMACLLRVARVLFVVSRITEFDDIKIWHVGILVCYIMCCRAAGLFEMRLVCAMVADGV